MIGSLLFAAWLVWGPVRPMRGIDYELMHHFFRVYLRDAIGAGEMPFWNPYTLLGRPFLADPEVAAFYPPTWLFLFLPESVAFWLVTGLHFALGGCGMARLAQRWGASLAAATIGGVAFVLTPPFLGHLLCGLIGYVSVIAWWPLLLLYTDRLCEKPRAREVVALTGALAASFLAGHSHAFWLCGCSLGFYILPRCCAGGLKDSLRRALAAYGALGFAALGALAICAIQLLPLLELVGEGNRVAGRDFAAAFGFPLGALQTLWMQLPSGPVGLEGQLYVGLPLLVLGLAQMTRVDDLRMRGLLVLALASLALALGRATPVFDLLYPLVPAMGYFRCNNRFGMFADWAIILAAVSFWRTGPTDRRSLAVDALLAAGIVVCAVARWAGLGVGWAASGGLIALALVVAAVWRNDRGASRAVFGLWVATWLIDFTPATKAFVREILPPQTDTAAADPIVVAGIREQLGVPPGPEPIRVFLPQAILKANSGMENGFSFVTGYGALSSARVWFYLHLATGVRPHSLFNTLPAAGIHSQRGPFPYKGANILLSWDADQGRLVRCAPAQLGSRAWLTRTVLPVAGEVEALQTMAGGFDPVQGVLIEPAAQDLVRLSQAGTIDGTVKITDFTRNRVAVAVDSSAAGVLVLAEAWYPGWRAEIDGVPAEVFPANAWMRGVAVPAGSHLVVFSFRSNYFVLGAAISLLALATWSAAWFKYRTSAPAAAG